MPDFLMLKLLLSAEPDQYEVVKPVLRQLRNHRLPVGVIQFVYQQLSRFVTYNRFASTTEEVISRLGLADLEGVAAAAQGFQLPVISNTNEATWFNAGLAQKLVQLRKASHPTVIKTMIAPLDKRLRYHGLQRGESLIWLAPTGGGKTQALCQSTYGAVLQRFPGVYFSIQLPVADIVEALAAYIHTAAVPHFDRYLHIARFPSMQTSVIMLRQYVDRLRQQEKFNPQYVVLDFLNYMIPNRTTREADGRRYYALQQVLIEFYQWLEEEKLVGFTAYQSNRGGRGQDVLTIENAAESYGAMQQATLVVSINRTPAEADAERARLYLAKYTYGRDKVVLNIDTNFAQGRFYRARS